MGLGASVPRAGLLQFGLGVVTEEIAKGAPALTNAVRLQFGLGVVTEEIHRIVTR